MRNAGSKAIAVALMVLMAISVFKNSANRGFAYTAFTKAGGEKEFGAYIAQCEKRAFYDAGGLLRHMETSC